MSAATGPVVVHGRFYDVAGRQIGSMYSGKLYDIGGHQTGCLAAINRYTALRPTLRMSVVLRQQTLPCSAWWWEVVSPAWSFWRWILWAGDLKGLE